MAEDSSPVEVPVASAQGELHVDTHTQRRDTFNLKILLLLSFGHCATDICQGALPAILPVLKTKLFLSYATAGLIMLASNVTSSVIQPFFGYFSDKKEKSFLIPLGCFFAGLGFSLVALPNHYVWVLLLTMLSGLGVASYHPEGYKTARFFTGNKMATGLAVFSVGGNLGFALGPIIALFIITHYGLSHLPFMVVFSLIFLLLLFFAWDAIAGAGTTTSGAGTTTSVKEGQDARTPKGSYFSLSLLVGAAVMRSWTTFGLMAYIPFYYIDHEKGDPLYAGALVSTFLIGGAVGTLGGSPLADRWGYKQYLILSLILTSALFPLIFVTHGLLLFVTLGAVGLVLISSFTPTIVMAQDLLPRNLGIASGLMVGFAIGTGGVGVTVLGVIADHFSVPVALKSITLLPLAGLLISLFIRYPLQWQPSRSP
ncbi:MAG: MFS transporter [Deltaproteobacteria bacterium]